MRCTMDLLWLLLCALLLMLSPCWSAAEAAAPGLSAALHDSPTIIERATKRHRKVHPKVQPTSNEPVTKGQPGAASVEDNYRRWVTMTDSDDIARGPDKSAKP